MKKPSLLRTLMNPKVLRVALLVVLPIMVGMAWRRFKARARALVRPDRDYEHRSG